MDFENLDPIDILAFATDELRNRISCGSDRASKALAILEYLEVWEADPAFNKLKELNTQFEKDLDWFNVSHPLNIDDIHGKLIALDFFTYCCINCMHVLPELKILENRFTTESGFVVIGVHSPKFENEKNSTNILSAIQRYNITHPIVNDPHCLLWNSLHIKCWPTILLLSPNGTPLLLVMGEGHLAFLEEFVNQALQYFTQKGQIKNFAIPLSARSDIIPASNLKFPTKIAKLTKAMIAGEQRYAIADAGHNRILIVDQQGFVLYRIGGCKSGFVDGDFVTARFNCPQGVSFINEDALVVADTENHAIRQINLSVRQVTTLAGTGKQGIDKAGGSIGTLQEISSPWDVAVFKTRDMDMSFHMDEENVPEKTVILISMAGTHQIWGYFPDGVIWWKFKKYEPQTCAALIGNGMEENRNNSYPQNAAFAQPSGMVIANDYLFIADSESSSIRKASLVDGKVMAVVGGDRNPLNLFAFGDVDGKLYNAKLQHPLSLAYNQTNNKLYVADTYNHKIKVIDIEANSIETCWIREAAQSHQLYKFNEPAGLCCDYSGQKLLVADTNNHSIQIIDLKTMHTKRLQLDFSQVLETKAGQTSTAGRTKLHRLLPLYGCKNLQLNINVALADNFKFTQDAPQTWTCNSSNFSLRQSSGISNGALQNGACTVQLQRAETEVDSTSPEEIELNFTLNLCDSNSCTVKRFTLILRNSDNQSTGFECINEDLNLNIKKATIEFS